MSESDFETKWQLLVADTWDDPELKQRLLDDPASVLKERGIEVPEGFEIKVHADSESVENLVLPAGPEEEEDEELEDEELEAVAGGGCRGRCFPRRCFPRRCFPRRCFPRRCFPRRCIRRCIRRCRCR